MKGFQERRRKRRCAAAGGAFILSLVVAGFAIDHRTSYLQQQQEVEPNSTSYDQKRRRRLVLFGDERWSFSTADPEEEVQPVIRTASQNLGDRPVIYTFYSPIDSSPSDDKNEHLLAVWKRYWEEAGWEPRVLILEDARQHPEWEYFGFLLQRMKTGTYNKLCFIRWVAMATLDGGGWMADFDTIPITDFTQDGHPENLPNDGVLTVHNGMCPSLVSGAQSEWYRMAKRIMEAAAQSANNIKSDQQALVKLYHRSNDRMFETDASVTQKMFAPDKDHAWTNEDCAEVTPSHVRAVHFAHSVVKKAQREHKLPAGWSNRNRPAIITRWMDMWSNACGGVHSFQADNSDHYEEHVTAEENHHDEEVANLVQDEVEELERGREGPEG